MSNVLTLTDLIKTEGGKKGEGIPSSLSYTQQHPPPPLTPVTQPSVWGILSSRCSTQGSSVIWSTDLYLCQL